MLAPRRVALVALKGCAPSGDQRRSGYVETSVHSTRPATGIQTVERSVLQRSRAP